MPIEIYPSVAKIKRNGVYENLPGFVPEIGSVSAQQMIATAESNNTAQYVHNKGEYFRLNDTLYQAIVKINIGDAIVVGTNCEVAVLGNDVTHIANSIAEYELGIATADHTTGEYFMIGETLYVATDDISVGDNISTSTNCRLAVMGDELCGLQMSFSEIFVDDSVDFTELTPQNRAIGLSSNKWTTANGNTSYLFPVPYGATDVTVQANNNYPASIALLRTEYIVSNQTPEYATGWSARVAIATGKTETFKIPNDCRYMYVHRTGSSAPSQVQTPTDVTFKISIMSANANDAKNILSYTDLITLFQTTAVVQPKVITDAGKISSASNCESYELTNNNYGAITITSQPNINANVSFLTASISELSAGDSVSVCNGLEPRYSIPANKTKTFEIPSDCTHIVFFKKYTGKIQAPLNGYVYTLESALLAVPKGVIDNTALGRSKTPVTACIIGASIEAGTTHETAESGAVINPAKAYLTVALQNNGVVVTNLSRGGMGFVRPSSQGSVTVKSIVDSTDFTAFESVYICLGYNDYNHNQPLGSTSDASGDATVCGMLKYCIETIYTSNPATKLFVKKMGGNGGLNSATVPYTQAELETAMETICASYGVEMKLLGAIVNNYNRSMIYPDGVHPSQAVMALMAKDTTGRITFK